MPSDMSNKFPIDIGCGVDTALLSVADVNGEDTGKRYSRDLNAMTTVVDMTRVDFQIDRLAILTGKLPTQKYPAIREALYFV